MLAGHSHYLQMRMSPQEQLGCEVLLDFMVESNDALCYASHT